MEFLGRPDPRHDDEQSLMNEFHRLLKACVGEFGAQYGAIQGETGRVQALLSEAIEQLTQSFQGMHEIIGTLEARAQRNANPGEPGAAVRATMEGRVNAAVTALQFHDMVSQLIDHVRKRVAALDGVVCQLGELSEVLRRDAAAADTRAAIDALKRETTRIASSLKSLATETIDNPVGQRAMTQGDIELF